MKLPTYLLGVSNLDFGGFLDFWIFGFLDFWIFGFLVHFAFCILHF